ncbi:MAG TPA: DsbC family protein [Lysobacter sp.]|nr:DsbC family protein [Lysobacter sp.]
MKRITFALLGLVSITACAQAPQGDAGSAGAQAATAQQQAAPARPAAPAPAANTPEGRALAALRTLDPNVAPDRIGAAPLPGFREAIVAGQAIYISDDGRYLFIPGTNGALFDTVAQKNLSEAALAGLRMELLKEIPKSERIVFAPANPRHTVTVFTDISCGFCRKFHEQIGEYNRQGIAVEYLAFPRMGLGSQDYHTMVSVWCAPDRRRALTDAKSDRPVPRRACKTTVNQQHALGLRVGLTGTPMILAADGTQLGGYVPPEQLRQRLDKLASETAAASN